MSSFCVDIPDEDVGRLVDALCANYKYQDEIPNPTFDSEAESGPDSLETIDNPETKNDFANRMTREFLMSNTYSYELKLAREAAISEVPTPPNITDPSI
ncbi:hypothetical protein CMI37_04725 [Candidatus Pacearchaeota archaeon]|nr:hypothetical protein [Candidatus Pacearchaeota archaeon]|tara:strand:- start:670 stop:966 length:297 start_codon:yes stop_codon:yes gene_type:complete